MSFPQHIYRRGSTYWWRRVHRLFDSRLIDVRLSLKTSELNEARNRGGTLTGLGKLVVDMLEARARSVDDRPTDEELRAIAKKAYGQRLAQFCADQTTRPADKEQFSIANRAYSDYYGRLAKNGGIARELTDERAGLRFNGWDDTRIERLFTLIKHVEAGDIVPIKQHVVDSYLRELGYPIHNGLRDLMIQALYPAYRDACDEAEARLQSPIQYRQKTELYQTSIAHEQPIPEDWIHVTPRQAAERYIKDIPKLAGDRGKGKRAKTVVDGQTLRQIRWAARLLEMSLPQGAPIWQVTHEDIINLDQWFDQISPHFGKSPSDRVETMTLEQAAQKAVDQISEGTLPTDEVGLSIGTSNKHFNKLMQVHNFACEKIPSMRPINFSKFTASDPKDERDAREQYTLEQAQSIFKLPPWTGCSGFTDRLAPGDEFIHDSLFYLILLVWYTGARREELCKLLISDTGEAFGILYISIRDTITGGVKNQPSHRLVAICNELMRLGFDKYIVAMRDAGETLLFPELMPGGPAKRKMGDVFYKIWWTKIRPHVPNLKRGQAMHAARHSISDALKQAGISDEFRDDLLGHGAKGDGKRRYPRQANLTNLKEMVEQIPVVTSQIPDQHQINLLPTRLRQPRPTRVISE